MNTSVIKAEDEKKEKAGREGGKEGGKGGRKRRKERSKTRSAQEISFQHVISMPLPVNFQQTALSNPCKFQAGL